MQARFTRSFFVASALALATVSCNSSDDDGNAGGGGNPGTTTRVGDYFSGLSTAGTTSTVTLKTENAPAGSAAGTVLAYSGGSTVAQGSTAQSEISSTDAFDTLLVSVSGIDGSYEVALDQPQTQIDLLLSLSTEAPDGPVDCLFQGRRAGDSEFGEPVTIPLDILDVGSGELQVNLTWNTDADLDISVFEPDGTRIWYAATTSPSGGELDLDANVSCGSVSVENIFWNQAPPAGMYRVAVDNFQACSQAESAYVISVSIPDQSPLVFSGVITEADGLVEVATFTIE